MDNQRILNAQRWRRRMRVRRTVRGNAERPRLSVFRSHGNIYAQLIDDETGRTLASASTVEESLRGSYGGNKTAAAAVGKLLAERAKGQGIAAVCFDRREYRYHGRVAALADAAREGGLAF